MTARTFDPRVGCLKDILFECELMGVTTQEYEQRFAAKFGKPVKEATYRELFTERDEVRAVRRSMDNPNWGAQVAAIEPRPLRDGEAGCQRCERIGIAQMVPCIHDTGEANEPGRAVQEWDVPESPSHRIFGL